MIRAQKARTNKAAATTTSHNESKLTPFFNFAVGRAALAIQAAANGAVALIHARFSKEEVIATSKLLFEGVLAKLCNTSKAL